MINHPADLFQLAPTAELLISGGDDRLTLDPATGRSGYGCQPLPDQQLVALGSSTATNISPAAYRAADALRTRCQHALRDEAPLTVYRRALGSVRQRLLAYCGVEAADSPMVLLAPSGTDVFMLAANLRQPQSTVLIAPAETGSGVPLALLGPRQGAPHTVAVRHADGSLRAVAEVDAEYTTLVDAAAARGRRVLLVLTDVSKSGLISPSIATVLALKTRWRDQLDVLVDACQFRLDPATLRAYLAHGCMLALTGSKFMAGPTFSGALLLPRAIAANAVEAVTSDTNFGMLLRWEAALFEMQRFAAVPAAARAHWAATFADATSRALAGQPQSGVRFAPLPVRALDRAALGAPDGWDLTQTVIPFTVRAASGHVLDATQARQLYLRLQQPAPGEARFHLGQPVGNALRLCLSAGMIADLHAGQQHGLDNIEAALARISRSCAAY